MKSVVKKIAQGLLLVPVLVLGFSVLAPSVNTAWAECTTDTYDVSSGANCAQGNNQPSSLFDSATGQGIFTKIVNIMLFLVGAIAVIMLIVGGIRYVTSGGAQDQVTAAKNTIMYAIVGIVVAVLAYAVVNFVVNGLMPQ